MRKSTLLISGAVMDMITKESTSRKEFVGTRIEEIRNKSDVGTWAWVQSKDNPADLGTHGIKTRGKWEKDPSGKRVPQWLKLNIQHWPIDYHHRENMPDEEINSDTQSEYCGCWRDCYQHTKI